MTYALITERMDEDQRLEYDAWLNGEDPEPIRLAEVSDVPRPARTAEPSVAQHNQEASLAAMAAAFAMEPASTMEQR